MRVEGIPPDAIHAYVDKRGFPTLKIDGPVSPLLAAAFEADIQTPSIAALIYERLDEVAKGREPGAYFSGNSCTVTIDQDRVCIENDILDSREPFEMSQSQYRVILDIWSALLVGS